MKFRPPAARARHHRPLIASLVALWLAGFGSAAAAPLPFGPVPFDVTARAGVAFSYRVIALNSSGAFAAEGLAPGLAIDAATGIITGQVDAPREDVATVSAAYFSNRLSTTFPIRFVASSTPPNTNNVSCVARSLDGLYHQGDTLRFIVNYAENVAISGAPRLVLTIGGATRYASYEVESSAVRSLGFSYTIQPGDVDLDGIAVQPRIDPNGGAIKGSVGQELGIDLPALNTSGVKVDTTLRPQALLMPAKGAYRFGSVLAFGVRYPEPVTWVGRPRISLRLDGEQRYAEAAWRVEGGRMIVFTYAIAPGDHAANLTLASSIELNGGPITTASGAAAELSLESGVLTAADRDLAGVTIDTAAPTTAPTVLPFNATGVANGGSVIVFPILASGEPTSYAADAPVSDFTFNDRGYFISDANDSLRTYAMVVHATNGVGTGTGTIKFVLTRPAPDYASYLPDTNDVRCVATPTDGTYHAGDTLMFAVQPSGEAVVLGTPKLTLKIGGELRDATFVPEYLPRSLVFRYQVRADDLDADGIEIASNRLGLTDEHCRDRAGYALHDYWIFAPDTSGVKIAAAAPPPAVVAPKITSATSVDATAGQPFSYTMTFSGDAPDTIAVSGAPAWLTRAGNVLSGTPSAAGNFTVNITASNAGGSDTKALTITVAAASTPPPTTDTTPPVTPPAPPPPAPKSTQSIDFSSPVSAFIIGQPVTLSAISSAGLPVTFSLVRGSATLQGNVLTATGTGEVVVRASQAGDATHEAASVEVNFGSPQKAAQSIAFATLSNLNADAAPLTLNASASSGLPVTLSVVSGPAVLSGNTLTLTGAAGTVVVRATQAGDATHEAATEVTRSFAIVPIGAQIYFGTAGSDEFAAAIAKDNSHGTLLARFGGGASAAVLRFAIAADGHFNAKTTPLGGSGGVAGNRNADTPPTAAAAGELTLNGRVADGVLTGTWVESGTSFTANVEPATGVAAGMAGVYRAVMPGSAAGEATIVVAPSGRALVVATTAEGTFAGPATVTSNGAVSATLAPGVSIAANLATDGALQGGVTAAGITRAISGLSDSTTRTDRLVNLSSRLRLGTDEASRTVVAGFVISGATPKRVLVRAIGPGLASFGLTDAVAAPRMQLFDVAGKLVVENNGWSNAAEVSAAGDAVGAFKLAAGSRDAALVATLAPGAYTAQVSTDGAAQAGSVLLEIYDLAATDVAAPQLVNLSTRGFVSAGGDLVAGFVVRGNTPKRVLVRGIGPGLAQFGLAGALADPTLKIFAGGASSATAANDNWQTAQPLAVTQTAASAPQVTAAATTAGAFPLASGSKDAVILITLAPGDYTAVVSSASGSGVALVEVYQLPE